MATAAPKEPRPVVFFDVSMGETALGRMKFELFKCVVANRTCEDHSS